jgi:serine/threonine protein kinase
MWQLIKSLDHMHKKGIFHRDVKPENILIDSSADVGKGLKLADFGSCRGIYSKQPYTEYISTRWYRAPECMLTNGYYGPEMDMWGAGCVMFEITSLFPLFPGKDEIDQVTRIHRVLGSPSQQIIEKFNSKGPSELLVEFPSQRGVGIRQLVPHATSDCIDLIVQLLKYDASERITAREAMRHPFFKDMKEPDRKSSTTSAPSTVEISKSLGNSGSVIMDSEDRSKDRKSSTIGLKHIPGQSSNSPQKVLPNILGKGPSVGGSGTNTQKQNQNFLGRASGATARGGGAAATAASTLPPISGGSVSAVPHGPVTQYGSTVGAGMGGRQQKLSWQQKRKKSKIGSFAGVLIPSPTSAAALGSDQYQLEQSGPQTTAESGKNGEGVGSSSLPAHQKPSAPKVHGTSSSRAIAGAKAVVKSGALGAITHTQTKDIPLNSKKIQL